MGTRSVRLGAMKRCSAIGLVVALVAVALVAAASPAAAAGSPARPAAAHLGVGSVTLDGSPGEPEADPSTGTVYVPIQCTDSSCATPSHVVDIISAVTCNAARIDGCHVTARVSVGTSPLAAVVDHRTETLYVVNGGDNGSDSSVSVVDIAHCNAQVATGCATPVGTVSLGSSSVAAALDPATRTLYVANPEGSVSVIDAAACNARSIQGCSRPVQQIADNRGPQALDVDIATDTVYTADAGNGNGTTVSVIDGSICNGHTSTGCGQTARTISVGSGAWWDTVDQATDTVYVANNNDGTVSVINGATCNATVTTGCSATPRSVFTGSGAQFVADDPTLHTVFTINQRDNTVSAMNTRTCNGTTASGCPAVAPAQRATPNHGPHYLGFPNALVLMAATNTGYVVNIGGPSEVSVLNLGGCNATTVATCRRPAPHVADPSSFIAVDPATDTVYASSQYEATVAVINGETCRVANLSQCAPIAEIRVRGPEANLSAIDVATHTLYASNPFGDTVSVINVATCNSLYTAGCSATAATMTIGPYPGAPVLDSATHTLYTPFGTVADKVAVTDAATCNAVDISGCGQSPAITKVGANTEILALSAATDTVYAPSAGLEFDGDTVSVINGATCNASVHSGCGDTSPTFRVGLAPFGIAIDNRTHTVYVANNAIGEAPGTVSVIDAATCNAETMTGCGNVATAATGRGPIDVAVDPRTDSVIVADHASASITVLDGARCNSTVRTGCTHLAREQAVGSRPFSVAVNPRTSTVYTGDVGQPNSISITGVPVS